jgi:ComEC/Rec2-related protein
MHGRLAPLFVACLGLVGCALVGARRRPRSTLVATVLISLTAGWSAAAIDARDGARLRSVATIIQKCNVEGRILEHHGGLGTFASIERADCAPARAGTLALPPIDLAPGTRFAATGWLRPLGREDFDVSRERAGADAGYIVETLTGHGVGGGVHGAAERFRSALKEAVHDLDDERRGLILGMTIGDTSDLPDTSLDRLRRAGLTHLLAVSGSNVAIVVGAVALACIRMSLRLRIAIGGACLAFYVLVVGPEPSVLRAGAMGGIALFALWRGRPTRSLSLLAVALIVVLLVRPGLVFAPGLHLSAAATAGIVVWGEPLASRLNRWPRPLALALGATLGAQFAVSPILLATFGEISLVSPAANLLAFPVVAPITVIGLAAGTVALVWVGGGVTLMSLVSPLAGWIGVVGERAGGPGWASVSAPSWVAVPVGLAVALAAERSLRRPAPGVDGAPRDDARMGTWRWRLHDPDGTDLRSTDPFDTQEAAEAWMGTEWRALIDEGAESVSLVEDDVTIYVMGLKEE